MENSVSGWRSRQQTERLEQKADSLPGLGEGTAPCPQACHRGSWATGPGSGQKRPIGLQVHFASQRKEMNMHTRSLQN